MVKVVSVGRAKKTHKIENFGFKVCSLVPRGDLHMRPRGNPGLDLEAARDQTSRQPTRTSRQAAMIGNELYHTLGSKGEGACGAISSFASWGVVQLVSYHRGLPRGPWGLPWALIAGCLELLCAGRLEVPGNKLWDQNFQFRCFFGPSDQNELHHNPLLSKI